MNDALARSVALSAADALGAKPARVGGVITDEEIAMHLWHVRGFRDHETLVQLINLVRDIIDKRPQQPAAPPIRVTSTRSVPVQLSLALVIA